MSVILDYMKQKGLKIDRATYFELAFWGDYDPQLPLPAEMECGLPDEIRWPNYENLTQEQLDLIFRDVPEEYMAKYD